MGFFDKLSGKSFGTLRSDLQQGFRGGSYGKAGESAINAFDPLISKERFANVMNQSVGGGTLFDPNDMNRQANVANTAGKLYTAYAGGNYLTDQLYPTVNSWMTPSATSAAPASSQGGWQKWAKMGAGGQVGGGGGQGQGGMSSGTASNMQMQQQTDELMRQQREQAKNQQLAELLRSLQNG